MSKVLVQTGFGYYKDQTDHVICKAQLPVGQHDLRDDLIYVEVNSQAELDVIEVWRDPTVLQAAEQNQKIADKLRTFAINELIKDGDWP